MGTSCAILPVFADFTIASTAFPAMSSATAISIFTFGKRWATNGQLSEVIGAQLANAIDEVELLLRRKLEATDGSVRSTRPVNAPPGYANSFAEYTKRLSKQ